MYKKVNFNIYEENLEEIVYGEKNTQKENTEIKDEAEQPIPKPPPSFWNNPLNYRNFERESEKAKSTF